MRLTNREVFQAREPLQALIGRELPAKTSYALAKIVSKLNVQLDIINTVRLGLINKYGTQTEKGLIVEDGENHDSFMGEFNEVLDEEVDFPTITEPVKLPEDINIEPSVFIALEKLVKA